MDTTRQLKINRMLQKELSEILLAEARATGHGTLLTVTNVRITPDLSIARVYLSIFPSNQSEAILEQVKGKTKSIRFQLGARIRHQLRVIPELAFYLDDSLDYIENIDNLLHKE
ncbi:30S ribosome-binding factor RbfA [Microbacter margulisiae]|uniref:Ribosome-binding factor A n=1 Tax=Microbacter margulisiae TaxID=1350067 RepID=A0A7W5DSY1_9PORP|nr:30S ribosome-binding factor RbfA [Microbacter margulisiae]MBB3188168.1 ribosome-binding factor A [Microbacter margulisiae]